MSSEPRPTRSWTPPTSSPPRQVRIRIRLVATIAMVTTLVIIMLPVAVFAVEFALFAYQGHQGENEIAARIADPLHWQLQERQDEGNGITLARRTTSRYAAGQPPAEAVKAAGQLLATAGYETDPSSSQSTPDDRCDLSRTATFGSLPYDLDVDYLPTASFWVRSHTDGAVVGVCGFAVPSDPRRSIVVTYVES